MLTKHERIAETIYNLVRARKLNKQQYCARMDALAADSLEGQMAAHYCAWLMLRAMPSCLEKRVTTRRLAHNVGVLGDMIQGGEKELIVFSPMYGPG